MAWNTIFIEVEKFFEVGNAYKIYIPEGVGFDSYSFFHPKKLVERFGDSLALTVSDSWQFKLTKTKRCEDGTWEIVDTVMLAVDELTELLDAVPTLYIPKDLEPLENVEPLQELLDE